MKGVQNMKGITKFKTIQMRIIVSFVLLFLVIALITGTVQYNVNTDVQFQDIKEDAIKLAVSASLLIDGDSHEELVKEGNQDSKSYVIMRNDLQEFVGKTEIAGAYTLAKKGEDKTQFIVDADEDPPELGEEYDFLSDMEPAFQGTPSSDEDVTTDEWGTVISGYAPVQNSQGETVAIVGIDIDASHINQLKMQQLILLITTNLVGLVLMVLLSFFVARSISKPIKLLAKNFVELSSSNNLTKKIETKTGDEIELLGNSINGFIDNVRRIIIQIKSAGENVATSADDLNSSIGESQNVLEEVNRAIESIAAGAASQAKDVNEISYGIQGISKDMNENESKVSGVNAAAGETRKLVHEGMEALNNQSIKTDENMEASQKATAVVEKLATEIEDVEKILETITSISDQTNLLALNAAIEAARAGEHGRGFAVVADEVRNLAEESAASTKEIAQILRHINEGTKEAVDQIEKTNLIANEQKVAVDNTSLLFASMTKEIESIIDAIGVINTSFRGIGENASNINDKVQDVSSISEENAAMSEEVSASSEEQNATMEEIGATAEELNELSVNLEKIISIFKV